MTEGGLGGCAVTTATRQGATDTLDHRRCFDTRGDNHCEGVLSRLFIDIAGLPTGIVWRGQ